MKIVDRTITIGVKPQNDNSGHICLNYMHLEAILAGEIETIIAVNSAREHVKTINNLVKAITSLKPRGEYFLLFIKY